ncbi:MAG TPA: cobalamin-independent methionine synthase II family protein [Gemmataceae bacterium]|nr:cobalamin-independent methionine synthase II family protein [Gemmataceae bacterium]
MAANTLFPTSVVGSLPRPDYVKDLINDAVPFPPEEYHRLMGLAIASAVAIQEAAGLDVITDGEWWRKSYIGVIAELAHGFELGRYPDGRPYTVVVARVAPKQPGFIAREVSFLKGITRKQIKATLPSPALLGERLWDAEKSAKAYPRREDFVRDCVPILRQELRLLVRESVSVAQIDDPHLCLFVDPDVRARYDDPDRAAAFAVDMTNQVVEGIGGVKLAVHLCRRAGARARGEARFRGGYGPILPHLNRLKVHHLTMEFTAPEAGDMAVFRDLREDFEIGLGCVGTEPGRVNTVNEIVGRVEMALKHLAADRITLNPDCGFAPGSAAVVSTDEVYQKLKNEVAAAQRLRERYRP